MRPYLIRTFDEFGQAVSFYQQQFADDLCALECARELSRDTTIEIWNDGHRVCHFARRTHEEPRPFLNIPSVYNTTG